MAGVVNYQARPVSATSPVIRSQSGFSQAKPARAGVGWIIDFALKSYQSPLRRETTPITPNMKKHDLGKDAACRQKFAIATGKFHSRIRPGSQLPRASRYQE